MKKTNLANSRMNLAASKEFCGTETIMFDQLFSSNSIKSAIRVIAVIIMLFLLVSIFR